MKNEIMEMTTILIYADATRYFTDEEIDANGDNMAVVNFPTEIVKNFFKECVAPETEISFEQWYNNEYTLDDTDGLFLYSVYHGYKPTKEDVELYRI